MKYIQAITPNPNIPCVPGWCLAYVNEAFGVPKRFGSATAAWNGSTSQHTDYDFPADLWVPLWFSLKNEPDGHVALRSPDGAIYSTTSPYLLTPTRHPNLADLIYQYSFYNPLTYRGWTEDVEGTPVITPEDDMADLTNENLKQIYEAVWFGAPGARLIPNELGGNGEWPYTTLGSLTARVGRDLVRPSLSAGEIADAVVSEMGNDIAKSLIDELLKRVVK